MLRLTTSEIVARQNSLLFARFSSSKLLFGTGALHWIRFSSAKKISSIDQCSQDRALISKYVVTSELQCSFSISFPLFLLKLSMFFWVLGPQLRSPWSFSMKMTGQGLLHCFSKFSRCSNWALRFKKTQSVWLLLVSPSAWRIPAMLRVRSLQLSCLCEIEIRKFRNRHGWDMLG